MESQILELRQLQSKEALEPGDYETLLSKEITIQEGDEILLNKVYIDTVSTSEEKIEIEKDITLSIDAYLYNINWNRLGKTYANTNSTLAGTGPEICVACGETSGGPPADKYTRLESVVYEWNGKSRGDGEDFWGGFELIIGFTDTNGNKNAKINVLLKGGNYKTTTGPFTTNIGVNFLTTDGYKILSPSPSQIANSELTTIDKFNTGPPKGDKIFTPIHRTMTIPIKQGSYDPDHIGKIITEKLTFNNNAGINFNNYNQLNNPFFVNSKDLSARYIASKKAFTDGPMTFTYADNYFVGASQIVLEYDEQTQRFKFSFTHTPLYDKNGNMVVQYLNRTIAAESNPAIDQERYPSLLGPQFTSIGRNSGLIFANLSATADIDNSPYDFWKAKLGITPSSITTNYKHINVDISSLGGNVEIPEFDDLVNGVNLTEGLQSIDTVISKVSGASPAVQDFMSVPNLERTISTSQTVIPDDYKANIGLETIPIYGNDIFQQSNFKFGYFQISIDASFKQYLVNELTVKRTIKGVVSRYFERNNYTSGTTDSGFVYIHRGEPIQLSSLRVRILDASGNLANNIGSDNTVFLEIRKQLKIEK